MSSSLCEPGTGDTVPTMQANGIRPSDCNAESLEKELGIPRLPSSHRIAQNINVHFKKKSEVRNFCVFSFLKLVLANK